MPYRSKEKKALDAPRRLSTQWRAPESVPKPASPECRTFGSNKPREKIPHCPTLQMGASLAAGSAVTGGPSELEPPGG